ncbi:DNA repair protein rad52 [Podila verticillata]|nr:DNA repair protein rad52 [Podila verticillata]
MNGPNNYQQQQQPLMQNDFGSRMPHLQQFTAPLARKRADFTPEEKIQITSDLKKYLAPEFTSNRSGPGGTQLTYIEAWRVKNVANSLFGFDGWSSTISDVTVDFLDVSNDGKVAVGVSVITRVTLKDGTTHEDIGYGNSEGLKSKAASFEKAKKEAASDSLKRAMTSFGNLFTCLYDKNFCRFVRLQKVEMQKFDPENVYRYPEDMAKRQQFHQQQAQQLHQQQQNWQGTAPGIIKTEPFRPINGAAQNSTTLGASGPSFSNMAQNQVAQNNSVQQFANNPQNNQNGLQNMLQGNLQNGSGPNDDDLPDDLFVGADIEDAKIFQAESPRFSDLDFDFTADMIQDSPELPRTEPPTLVRTSYVPSTPENARSKSGSGSFSRTVSSPSLVQTTPTKATTSTNGGDSFKVQPPQYKGKFPAKPNTFTPSTSTSTSGQTNLNQGAGTNQVCPPTPNLNLNPNLNLPNPNLPNPWIPQGTNTSMRAQAQTNVDVLRANSAANSLSVSSPPKTTEQGNGSSGGISTSIVAMSSYIKGPTLNGIAPSARVTPTPISNGVAKGPAVSSTTSNQSFSNRSGPNINTAGGSTNTAGAIRTSLQHTSVQNGAMSKRQPPITVPSFTNHPNTNLGLKRPMTETGTSEAMRGNKAPRMKQVGSPGSAAPTV